MLCARILAGVGTGGISAVIPVWSSELVAHDSRGAVIAFEMVVNYAGIFSACETIFTIVLSAYKLTGSRRLA
jgi:MFS family permease